MSHFEAYNLNLRQLSQNAKSAWKKWEETYQYVSISDTVSGLFSYSKVNEMQTGCKQRWQVTLRL